MNTCAIGPCCTDGLPANAEGNMQPSLILIPTRVWHVGDKPQTVRVHGGQQEPRAGADTLAVVLQKMSPPQGSPGCKQTGQPASQPDLAAAS